MKDVLSAVNELLVFFPFFFLALGHMTLDRITCKYVFGLSFGPRGCLDYFALEKD